MRRRTSQQQQEAEPTPPPQPPAEPDTPPPPADASREEKRCHRLRAASLGRNVRVQFMLERIRLLGCDTGPAREFVQCTAASRAGALGDKMVGGRVALLRGRVAGSRRCA